MTGSTLHTHQKPPKYLVSSLYSIVPVLTSTKHLLDQTPTGSNDREQKKTATQKGGCENVKSGPSEQIQYRKETQRAMLYMYKNVYLNIYD